jgi:Flp pilus assembly protein TadB
MKLLAEVERRTELARREEVDRAQKWRDEDKKWQKQIEALVETRHQELRRDDKAGRKTDRTMAIVLAVVGVVASIFVAWLTAYLTG